MRHADYLGEWLSLLRDDSRAIFRAASAASKAADHLLAFRDGEPPASPRNTDTQISPQAAEHQR